LSRSGSTDIICALSLHTATRVQRPCHRASEADTSLRCSSRRGARGNVHDAASDTDARARRLDARRVSGTLSRERVRARGSIQPAGRRLALILTLKAVRRGHGAGRGGIWARARGGAGAQGGSGGDDVLRGRAPVHLRRVAAEDGDVYSGVKLYARGADEASSDAHFGDGRRVRLRSTSRIFRMVLLGSRDTGDPGKRRECRGVRDSDVEVLFEEN